MHLLLAIDPEIRGLVITLAMVVPYISTIIILVRAKRSFLIAMVPLYPFYELSKIAGVKFRIWEFLIPFLRARSSNRLYNALAYRFGLNPASLGLFMVVPFISLPWIALCAKEYKQGDLEDIKAAIIGRDNKPKDRMWGARR